MKLLSITLSLCFVSALSFPQDPTNPYGEQTETFGDKISEDEYDMSEEAGHDYEDEFQPKYECYHDNDCDVYEFCGHSYWFGR